MRQFIPFAISFALIGTLPWIAESLNPSTRYPELDSTILKNRIAELQSQVSIDDINEFGDQPETITLQGRLLYPRTFSANTGLTSTNTWPAYEPHDYPRMGFRLLNQDLYDIIFPNKGVPIENVQGYDVILLGCERESYVEARLLVFPNENLTYLSNLRLEPCSP